MLHIELAGGLLHEDLTNVQRRCEEVQDAGLAATSGSAQLRCLNRHPNQVAQEAPEVASWCRLRTCKKRWTCAEDWIEGDDAMISYIAGLQDNHNKRQRSVSAQARSNTSNRVLPICMCEQCFRPRPLPNGDCSNGPMVARSAPCWCCNRAFLQDRTGSLSLSCISFNPAFEGNASETPVAKDSRRTKCCVACGLPVRDFCQRQFVCTLRSCQALLPQAAHAQTVQGLEQVLAFRSY